MRRLLLGNVGNCVILLFILQVQLIIKGSNAFPGNSQGRDHDGSKKDVTVNTSVEAANESSDTGNTGGDAGDFGINVNNFEFEEASNRLEQQQGEEKSMQLSSVELVAPRPINGNLINLEITESPDSDRNSFTMLRASLRPKSISRQSGCQTPVSDDWIDVSSQASEYSSNTRIAQMIYSTASIVTDNDFDPISFDSLCSLLEETADKEMGEDELLLICKRVISNSDTLIKALKDLPLFIKNYRHNQNAVKINSILYSYLAQSNECFKDILSQDYLEHGSVSSTCSSRGTESTIESPPNSPIIDSFDLLKVRNPSTSPRIEEGKEVNDISGIRVLEEINRVQSHVPHPPFVRNLHLGYISQSRYPRFNLRQVNSMQVPSLLYTLQEESKSRTISSEDESPCLIEEVD
jgi:hypothetical protein